MISVKYQGGLGNVLFQYCFSRMLAEKLGYRLNAKEIHGFPATQKIVDGVSYEGFEKTVLSGHNVNLSDFSHEKKSHIFCDGYFQNYDYYKGLMADIKNSWLVLDEKYQQDKKNVDDVVIHIRRGDYLTTAKTELISFEGYEKIINDYVQGWRSLYICTDSPEDPFVKKLVQKYGAILYSNQEDTWRKTPIANPTETTLDDFSFIMSFNRIVLSVSTFSWWSSVLSDATEIFYPLHGAFNPKSSWKGNLVIDEPRTIFCEI